MTKAFLFSVISSTFLFAAEAPIASGKLILKKELAGKATGIRTVFISVQDPAAAMPMPCAAAKLTLQKDASGEFYDFKLEPASLMMMACQSIPETFNLKAKLDKDGSAGRDGAGDIVGTLSGVKKGSSGLKLNLDTPIQ